MTRNEYRKARRLVRDNGKTAFRWMAGQQLAFMQMLHAQKQDELRNRAWIAQTFGQDGIAGELRYQAAHRALMKAA